MKHNGTLVMVYFLLIRLHKGYFLFQGKSLGMKIFLFLSLFTSHTMATKIIYSDISEELYHNNSLYVTIKAHTKIDNIEEDISTLFLNRKKYISKHFYYENGFISHSMYQIYFNRMFIYGKNIYMNEVEGRFFKYKFHAKKAVIYRDRIFFSHIFFESKNKKGSRLKFIYYFDKKNEIE